MKSLMLTNWKTSVSGIVTAAAGFVVATPELFTGHPWVVAIAKYLMAGGFMALGFSSKDLDVTGGTKLNTPPAQDSQQLKAEGK